MYDLNKYHITIFYPVRLNAIKAKSWKGADVPTCRTRTSKPFTVQAIKHFEQTSGTLLVTCLYYYRSDDRMLLSFPISS